MTTKVRLSATVDDDLLTAGRAAVKEGRVESLSAWVNDALARQKSHDERLSALEDLLAAYESEFGEITEDEIEAATRRARSRAIVVRTDRVSERRELTS